VFALSVGLYVSLLETSVYFGRMAEATEMPFGVVGWVVPGKKRIKWGPNPSMERGNFGGA